MLHQSFHRRTFSVAMQRHSRIVRLQVNRRTYQGLNAKRWHAEASTCRIAILECNNLVRINMHAKADSRVSCRSNIFTHPLSHRRKISSHPHLRRLHRHRRHHHSLHRSPRCLRHLQTRRHPVVTSDELRDEAGFCRTLCVLDLKFRSTM